MVRFATIAVVLAQVTAAAVGGDDVSAPRSCESLGSPVASQGIAPVDVNSSAIERPQTDLLSFAPSLTVVEKRDDYWISLKDGASAEFPKSSRIPGTEVWWKFGGFVKADFIHDFEPAGTLDRWVPTTIPVDGERGQNTLMQAKASRLNLDVRAPTDWGVIRGFVESDFFTTGNQLRLRHAYAEVGPFLAGQTWTVFTDPDGIPRTLDFESPISFIVQRNPQFRWTETLNDNLKWATSIENPTTEVDDDVLTSIPGRGVQPMPDLATHLKYKSEYYEWFIAGLFRDLAYRPDGGEEQQRFGHAVNFVGILRPTKDDKIIGQFVMGSGLGRYRVGTDLRLASPTKVGNIQHMGGCIAVSHNWTETLSSSTHYSIAIREREKTDPPDTPWIANYAATNLLWTPIANTTLGVEYLYGTNEVRSGAFGDAHRIQATVQYNFP